MSQSRDIIGTDKVAHPCLASGHNTPDIASMYNDKSRDAKNRRKKLKSGSRGWFYGDLVSGRANVRLVGFVRASASKLLLELRPNHRGGSPYLSK